MAASDYYPKRTRQVLDGNVTAQDRVLARLKVWLAVDDVVEHAPEDGTFEAGTVSAPIRDMMALKRARDEYRQMSDATVIELTFWDRLREAVRMLCR